MRSNRSIRQTRSLPTSFTTREDSEGKHIEGYFAVFGTYYDIWPGARETVAPGAFDGQLDGDVRALTDHVTHLVLGRTTAGTLALRQDDKGLWGDILINEQDGDALNLYARVQRGDVNQCSFGFDIEEEDRDVVDGIEVYTIRAVTLYEVSVVTFPAYEETSVSARSLGDLRRIRLERWRNELKERIKRNG